ncbi:hypothetical protein DPEC_G00121510 [Dallia pectoralis]|uniref:Uncharacterized protein n=1 Tax=Dallia pectoralis TaxID=75939 RepID=A0ACC2GQD0_DALPE|nr:hypothetical protein DPEC_G00121510 [Dallia pectoralis]
MHQSLSQRYHCSEQRHPSHFRWKAKSLHQPFALSVRRGDRSHGIQTQTTAVLALPALIHPGHFGCQNRKLLFSPLRSSELVVCYHLQDREIRETEGEDMPSRDDALSSDSAAAAVALVKPLLYLPTIILIMFFEGVQLIRHCQPGG